MVIDPLLQLLRKKARYSTKKLAQLASLSEAEVETKIAAWEKDGTILGYHAVVNLDKTKDTTVYAFIEVKLALERGGGFDRLAMRIARFDHVSACYLASGGYDLMLLVNGESLGEVSSFVSEKLATVEGVHSCTTCFKLKGYKEHGFVFESEELEGRLSVSP